MNLVSLWWMSKLTLAWNCTKCSLYKMHNLILVIAKFSSLVLDKSWVRPSFWKFFFLPIEELPPILAQRCITKPPFKSQEMHHIWACKPFSYGCGQKLFNLITFSMWTAFWNCTPNACDFWEHFVCQIVILSYWKNNFVFSMWKFKMSYTRLWVFSNDINNILSQMTSSNNLNVGHLRYIKIYNCS
jgi:hypothetical protein